MYTWVICLRSARRYTKTSFRAPYRHIVLSSDLSVIWRWLSQRVRQSIQLVPRYHAGSSHLAASRISTGRGDIKDLDRVELSYYSGSRWSWQFPGASALILKVLTKAEVVEAYLTVRALLSQATLTCRPSEWQATALMQWGLSRAMGLADIDPWCWRLSLAEGILLEWSLFMKVGSPMSTLTPWLEARLICCWEGMFGSLLHQMESVIRTLLNKEFGFPSKKNLGDMQIYVYVGCIFILEMVRLIYLCREQFIL